MSTGGQRVPLFAASGTPSHPLECRACGRSFRRVNGTAAHAFAHQRRTPEAVTVEPTRESYRFWYHTDAAGVSR